MSETVKIDSHAFFKRKRFIDLNFAALLVQQLLPFCADAGARQALINMIGREIERELGIRTRNWVLTL